MPGADLSTGRFSPGFRSLGLESWVRLPSILSSGRDIDGIGVRGDNRDMTGPIVGGGVCGGGAVAAGDFTSGFVAFSAGGGLGVAGGDAATTTGGATVTGGTAVGRGTFAAGTTATGATGSATGGGTLTAGRTGGGLSSGFFRERGGLSGLPGKTGILDPDPAPVGAM